MRFAILRTQKLKHLASVRRSLKHAFREQDTPNADPERVSQNTHIGAADVAQAMVKVEALLPEKRRSDAVLAIEYLITASPEAMQGKSRAEQDAYFLDALDWLKQRHGAENVVYAGIHRDEHTPHLYAYAVPLDAATGRLNAKKWLGGAGALRQMQTEFAERVGRTHGLERGIEGSRATHQTVRQFYAGLESTPGPAKISAEALKPRVIEKGFLTSKVETSEAVAERITTAVQAHYAPQMLVAGNARADRKRAAELVATAKAHQVVADKAKPLVELLGGLRPEQMREVAQIALQHQKRNRIEAEAQRRVDQFTTLTKRAGGATFTFATHAIDAIKAKAGEWRRVNWSEVENASVREAVHEHRQSHVSAYRAVIEHSPGQAGATKEQVTALLERAVNADREAGLKPETPARRRDYGPTL